MLGYYNNWFVTDVRWWLSPAVTALREAFDASHLIFTKRDNDLIFQTAAVKLFTAEAERNHFVDWTYQHHTMANRSIMWGGVDGGAADANTLDTLTDYCARYGKDPQKDVRTCVIRDAAFCFDPAEALEEGAPAFAPGCDTMYVASGQAVGSAPFCARAARTKQESALARKSLEKRGHSASPSADALSRLPPPRGGPPPPPPPAAANSTPTSASAATRTASTSPKRSHSSAVSSASSLAAAQSPAESSSRAAMPRRRRKRVGAPKAARADAAATAAVTPASEGSSTSAISCG
mmetsp:Transcript_24642/g.80548  ORF Transcript_24642/g.80548 Transcript_24642/m.80548 type:complete len:292 (+) Transcript_24642:520-1395(+)